MVRTQVFPANSLTKVIHEYRPDVGSGIPQWLIQKEGDLWFTADEWEIRPEGLFREIYFGCTSWIEYSSAVLHWKDPSSIGFQFSNSDGPDHVPIYQNWLSYILVTGANWSGPIGHFRLEISTDGRQIVNTCFDGLERVSDTSLVFEATDFTPTQNLSVTFHAPQKKYD